MRRRLVYFPAIEEIRRRVVISQGSRQLLILCLIHLPERELTVLRMLLHQLRDDSSGLPAERAARIFHDHDFHFSQPSFFK